MRMRKYLYALWFLIRSITLLCSCLPMIFFSQLNAFALQAPLVCTPSREYSYSNLLVRVTNPHQNYCKTSEGAIQIGMTMLYRLLYDKKEDYARIVIVPENWVGKDGSNIMQIYFAIACNYAIHKRKTILVCSEYQRAQILTYLKLGNPYRIPTLPHDYLTNAQIEQFYREAIYLADRFDVNGTPTMVTPDTTFDEGKTYEMIEFQTFDAGRKVQIGNVSIHALGNTHYQVTDSKENATYQLDGAQLKELTVDIQGKEQPLTPFIPPQSLKATFLGTSSGLDPQGLSSSYILWAGKHHILVDVGPATLPELKALGIGENPDTAITDVIITHMHEDHMAGVFGFLQWCKDNQHKINLIIEPHIFAFLEAQAKLVLNGRTLQDTYGNILKVTSLQLNKPLILGKKTKETVYLTIEANAAFHGTLTTQLRFTYGDDTITHSSDTAFDPLRFADLIDEAKIPAHVKKDFQREAVAEGPVLTLERVKELTEFPLTVTQQKKSTSPAVRIPIAIIYEVGTKLAYGKNNGNHTSAYTLNHPTNGLSENPALRRALQERMWGNHANAFPSDLGDTYLHWARPMSTIPEKEDAYYNNPLFLERASPPQKFSSALLNSNKVQEGIALHVITEQSV